MLPIIFSPKPEKDSLEIWEYNEQYNWTADISGVLLFQITLRTGDFVSLLEIMETCRSMTSKTTSRTCFPSRGLVWIFCSQTNIAACSPGGEINRIVLLSLPACFNKALQDSWLRYLYSFHLMYLKLLWIHIWRELTDPMAQGRRLPVGTGVSKQTQQTWHYKSILDYCRFFRKRRNTGQPGGPGKGLPSF